MQPEIIAGTLPPNLRSPVSKVQFSADGGELASVTANGLIRVWRNWSLALNIDLRPRTVRGPDRVRGLAFAPGGSSLFVASGDSLKEVDLTYGTTLWRTSRSPMFGFLLNRPRCVTSSYRGFMVSAYDDGVIERRKVVGGLLDKALTWHDHEAPQSVHFLRDGRVIVGSNGHSVCFWDAFSGAKLGRLIPGEKVCTLATCPSADILAIRTLHRILLWDYAENRLVASMPTLRGLPTLAFSSCGTWLAGGDALGVSVFDLKGNLLDRYPQIDTITVSLAFVPGRQTMAIGSADGSVVIWRFDPERLLMPLSR